MRTTLTDAEEEIGPTVTILNEARRHMTEAHREEKATRLAAAIGAAMAPANKLLDEAASEGFEFEIGRADVTHMDDTIRRTLLVAQWKDSAARTQQSPSLHTSGEKPWWHKSNPHRLRNAIDEGILRLLTVIDRMEEENHQLAVLNYRINRECCEANARLAAAKEAGIREGFDAARKKMTCRDVGCTDPVCEFHHGDMWEHEFVDGYLATQSAGKAYTEEELKRWWPAKCPKCLWRGLSRDAGGGQALADTGDFGDVVCPKCGTLVDDDNSAEKERGRG